MNRCTIVTAYYRIKSKHTYSEYDKWISNFLTTVDNEMVIFCDQEYYEQIKQLREPYKNKTVICIIPLEELECAKEPFLSTFKNHWTIDIEKHIHNYKMYVIWNEKPMFVKKVIEQNPFQTNFFMWCDIGFFRNENRLKQLKKWPSQYFLDHAKKDKVYFLNIQPFEETDFIKLSNNLTKRFDNVNRIGAGCFLAYSNTFLKWIDKYYNTLERYILNNYFAGKEQNIMASMYILYPELFELITPNMEKIDDPWFYFQVYFNS